MSSAPPNEDQQDSKNNNSSSSSQDDATVQSLNQALSNIGLDSDELDPTLSAGELVVRLAGQKEPSSDPSEVPKAMSFASLPICKELKDAVAREGWTAMSKIQQIGLPLSLADPPRNVIGQGQAGSGKTVVFVLTALSRMDPQFLKADRDQGEQHHQGECDHEGKTAVLAPQAKSGIQPGFHDGT